MVKLEICLELLNALFSGLAFAALIYTIKLQRDEIKESKTQSRYTRFTDEFFKFIDLHNNVYDQLNSPLAYYEEKQIKNPRTNVGDPVTFIKYYREYVEKQDVIKNFGNYLKIFEVTVNFIVTRKTLWKSRDKYFTIYFGMFHRKEKRFLIYHYNLTAEKPKHWAILKDYLYLDFSLAHIEEKEFKDILGLKD